MGKFSFLLGGYKKAFFILISLKLFHKSDGNYMAVNVGFRARNCFSLLFSNLIRNFFICFRLIMALCGIFFMGVLGGGMNFGVDVGGKEAFAEKIILFLRKIKRLETTKHFNVNLIAFLWSFLKSLTVECLNGPLKC